MKHTKLENPCVKCKHRETIVRKELVGVATLQTKIHWYCTFTNSFLNMVDDQNGEKISDVIDCSIKSSFISKNT